MRNVRIVFVVSVVAAVAFVAGPASAHVHVISTPNHTQELANGQNHPGFVGNVSCDGVLVPVNAGPAGYGLETAHHGPDSGIPGSGDGCYERDAAPDGQNPAID